MVGAGAVVAERDRRPRPDEHGAGVAHPGGVGGGVGGLDLGVLGGVGVDHLEALVDVVDQHDAGLLAADSAVRMRSTCRVAATCLSSSASTSSASRSESVTSTEAAIGSCSAWLIRSAATYAASAVSSARMAISVGPASESMPDDALEQSLGRDGVDVAGSGDQVDAAAGTGAVGEHGDRLGAADGVDLVDAEQLAGREDRRVREARRWSFWGELVSAIEPTPATWAGTTFISTLETSGATPPGT